MLHSLVIIRKTRKVFYMWFGWNEFECINNEMYFLDDYVVFQCTIYMPCWPSLRPRWFNISQVLFVRFSYSAIFNEQALSIMFWSISSFNVSLHFQHITVVHTWGGREFEPKLNVESFQETTSIISLNKEVFKVHISLQLRNDSEKKVHKVLVL